jgi:tetratricopeptide (TPR) repeat protein
LTTALNNFLLDKKKVFLVLALTPFLLYFKSLFFDFSPMDEQWLIINKFQFLNDWSNIGRSFTSPVGEVYFRPLLTFSFMLNASLSGLHPFTYHLLNLILHILCVLSLYKLLRLLSVENVTSFLLSLLFAVHPVLLHAVAWVPGRNDTMLALFLIQALIWLFLFLHQKKVQFMVLHFVFFTLALLTKENAALLPIIFAAFVFVIGYEKKKFNELVIFWVGLVLCWYFLRQGAVNFSLSTGKGIFVTLIATVQGLITYIGKILLPFSNSVAPTPKNSSLLYGIITIALMSFLFFKFGMKNKKMTLFAIGMFFVLLIIPTWYGASSPIGEQYEHRIYAPLIAFMILLSQVKFEAKEKVFHFVLIGITLLFAVLTFLRMDIYKNDLSYLEEGIHDCPENYVFHFQKANTLFKKKRLKEAIDCYSDALKLHPTRPQLLANRAECYSAAGMKDKAIADFNTLIKLNPDPKFLIGRFNCYKRFGDIPNAMNDLALLKKEYGNDIDLSIEPAEIQKWNASKLKQLSELIQKEPNRGILYVNRAKAYMDLRMGSEALADLKKACELEPRNTDFKRYYNELSNSFHGK